MARTTRKHKKSRSGSQAQGKIVTPVKKKDQHAKHAPMIDAIKQASENLRISHSFAPFGGQKPKLNNEMGGSPSLDKKRIVCVTVFRKKAEAAKIKALGIQNN